MDPTDKPVCVFYYRKGKAWLQLMTWGEDVKDIKVYYWADQAPESLTQMPADKRRKPP